jgi:hypothetical protein
VKDGELVFVPGNPGNTDRLDTMAELAYIRDTGWPFYLQRLNRLEVLLSAWSARSSENARKAKGLLFSVQNSRKARRAGLAGLMDPQLMAHKGKAEEAFKAKLEKDPTKYADALKAFDRIAEAQRVRKANIVRYNLLEGGSGFFSDLFGIARTLVRAADERAKSNGERLTGFTDASLPSLKQQLFSKKEIFDDYEELKLGDALTFLAEQLGYKNELVQKVLGGKSPEERARELISGTRLKDVAVRKKLFEGGKEAIASSDDPMIALAKLIDPEARAVRKVLEEQVEEVSRQAYGEIARAKFAVEGKGSYPDATFTLRLSFGAVKGYEEAAKQVPALTDFAGLYERAKEHDYKFPFDLPKRWEKAEKNLDLKTPFNFVCTADIIGGNSGSPVINRNAEVVGLIFDGNIQSLVLDYIYTEKQARAVAVASQGIIEALRKVYGADEIADEMTGKRRIKEAGQ